MGIKGLYSYIAYDIESYNVIDLVQEAKENNGIEILVDFNEFRRYLNEIILRIIINKFKNPYLSLLCSEYDIYSDAYLKFHQSFADDGIKLIWIADSAKGIDSEVDDQKRGEWFSRRKKTCERTDGITKKCGLKIPLHKLENITPLYNILTILDKLKKGGAEVIQLLQGGSDEFIASEFKRRKSFAILSGDTDFLVFPDCTVIFLNLMKTKYGDDLLLPFIDYENNPEIFKKPDKFLCPVISQCDVIQKLKMKNSDQLIILSIVKGNDNIKKYYDILQIYLNLKTSPYQSAKFAKVVDFIIKENINSKNIFQNPKIKTFLEQLPTFKKSFQFCLNFYTLKHFRESDDKEMIVYNPDIPTGPLTNFFRRKLANSEIVYKTYTIHLGIFNDTIIAENLDGSYPSITKVLLDIRKRIYPYILNSNKNKVLEKRHRQAREFFKIKVKHAIIKTNEIIGKPNSESERQDGVVYGIDLFEEIWSHLEDGESLDFMKKFGIEMGFICYILRYFYKVTHDINIKLSIEEFNALFAAIFYQYSLSNNPTFNTKFNRNTFMEMKICPSRKCFITLGWFTEVYYHGKHLSGNAFNVSEYFPSIEIIISSSVYTAFYENAMNDKNGRLSRITKSIQKDIANLVKQVLRSFNKEYDIVVR